MSILAIIELVIEVIKLLLSSGILSQSQKVTLMQKIRMARQKALETGDTSELEALKKTLLGG